VILPPDRWKLINFRELWQYRELLSSLVWRDVKVRYKQTVLGAAWSVLQPAAMMVVFAIFFGRVAHVSSGNLPYPLFACAGLLPWTFFATAILNASNSVVGSEKMITKIYFPRLAVPFAAVGAALVDLAISFGLLVVIMIWYRVPPGIGLLLVPAIVGLISLAALGIGTLFAALNVAYRDFRYVIPFVVQVGLFATPTVYMQSETTRTGWLQPLLALNPLTALVAAFRAATLGGPIAWGQLGLAAATSAALFLLGCLYFRKVEESLADII
jgi:lipopolysaccharide transport system permease protein